LTPNDFFARWQTLDHTEAIPSRSCVIGTNPGEVPIGKNIYRLDLANRANNVH